MTWPSYSCGWCICCHKESSANTIPNDVKSKICILRTAFVGSMIAAAIICGSVTFTTVQQYEYDLLEQSYYSVVTSAVKGAQAIAQRKITTGRVMVSMLSHNFPNASIWPFAAQNGFTQTGLILSSVSLSNLTFNPFVRLEERAEFEAFAANVYKMQNYPPKTGISEFGFGIWESDPMRESPQYSDGRIHSTGENRYGGKYNLMAPIFLHTNVSSVSLMLNAMADKSGGQTIEKMLDCSYSLSSSNLTSSCAILSELLELRSRPGPATVLYDPIYPANDPTSVVGYISTPISWDDTLKNIVPDFIKGLYCVVTSSTKNDSYTFLIDNGIPILIGKGDLHDTSYDQYKKTVVITADVDLAATSALYNLSIYPSDEVFHLSRSAQRAWAIPLGFVAVIIFSTTLFILYDIIMRNEAKQQEVILEVKRRFVRFVSHEIRTPLNTVCLGLELLQSDLSPTKGKTTCDTNSASKETKEGDIYTESVEDQNYAAITQTVDDILENANNAVGILNDLLNYDKMEQGTFNLEVSTVDIWDVVSRTVSSFDIQAKKRSIELTCKIDRTNVIDDDEDSENSIEAPIDLGCLKVMGDDVRIRQVVRNIISNSLKFSPEGTGKIKVTMRNNPKGLPNAITPRGTDIVNAATSNVLSNSFPRAGSIQILVRDNGVGLTEAQLQRLFQEGVQFEPNKLQDGGGSGLGLHITKRLVEQHGGSIIMMSDGPGCGCTVIIELPLYKYPPSLPFTSTTVRSTNYLPAPGAITNPINSSSHGKKVESSPDYSSNSSSTSTCTPSNALLTEEKVANLEVTKKGRKCLVVDDSLPNRKMLVRLLERCGHTCLSADNGQEAVDMIEADNAARMRDSSHIPIDSILMDYEMPIMNGPDATKIIRDKGYLDVLIIGVTGNVLTEDVNYFKAHGANTVLPKPVKVTSLEEYWETLSSET